MKIENFEALKKGDWFMTATGGLFMKTAVDNAVNLMDGHHEVVEPAERITSMEDLKRSLLFNKMPQAHPDHSWSCE